MSFRTCGLSSLQLDPTLQCPASSSDETSEDSKEEPAVDHLEHLSDVKLVMFQQCSSSLMCVDVC